MEHKAHNRITKLIDPQGIDEDTHKETEVVLVQHFQSIAKETMVGRSQFTKSFTQHIPKLVTREDNYNFNRPVTEEDVNEVIEEMHNCKAPGLDCFNVEFFKTCWEIIKYDILDVVDSRESKIVMRALNELFISLIPK